MFPSSSVPLIERLESRRLLAAVTPDSTFGSSGAGYTFTNFGGNYEWASDMLVQGDGKIVVVGNGPNLTYAAARYNTNGTLDPTFGSGGKSVLAGTYGWPYKAALQKDGKILLTGNIWNAAD